MTLRQRHYYRVCVGTVLCSDGRCSLTSVKASKHHVFVFFLSFPPFILLPCFFTVCVTPGEGKLPSGVYPGCWDQQAEAHRPADSPLTTDLMTHGRTKNKQRVMWKDWKISFCNYMFTPTKTERLWLPVTFICIIGLWFDRLLLKNMLNNCCKLL